MATQTTGGGSTTSFSNAPQAQGDAYAWTEDQLKASSLYNSSTNTITLDVMANDLGGKAKTLWSIDDGGSNFMTELLQSNITTSWERTAEGNWMRISNGKIEYRIADGSNSPDNARSVDSLAGGEHIQDSFYYSIRLGNGTLSYAKVTLDITGQNDGPTFGGSYEGSVVEAGGTNNSDPGSPTATGTLHVYDADSNQNHFQAPLEAALEGTYGKFSFDASTGAWTYALDNARLATQALPAGQHVTDTLTVWSADGTASQDIVVTVTGTNDAPAVSGAVSGGATEGGAAVTLNALANATDVDDGTTLQVVDVPTQLPAGVSYDAATHSFTLDPKHAAYDHLAAGQPTTVTVNYAVSDGVALTAASVSWTVTGTNDAPAVSGAVSGGATEGGAAVTLNALANATDVDDGTTLQVVDVPAQLPAGVSYDAATHSFTLDPKHAAYDHLAAGQPTTVTVNYAVSDGVASTATSATWTVTGTNDAPAVSGAVSGGATEGGAAVTLNALANATDVDDGTTLQVVDVPAQLPAGVSYDAATHSFTLDPKDAGYDHLAAGQPTTVTVNYAVSDGVASTATSATWTVTGTNDAPAVSGAVSGGATEGGAAVTLNALANASDVDDGTTLQVVDVPTQLPAGVSYDAATHSFTLDPKDAGYDHLAAGQPTTVTVNYAVSDGVASTATSATWTVTGTNDAPTTSAVTLTPIAEDSASRIITQAELRANASDIDGDSLTATNLEIAIGNGSLVANANGTWTYTPAANDDTGVSFSYTITDGHGGSVAGTASLDITPVNDAPTNTVPGAQTVNSNTASAINGVAVADVDSPNVSTTVSVGHGKLTVGTGGGATVSNNDTNAVTISGTLVQVNAALAALSYLGNINYSGTDTLTVATSDGFLSDTDTVAIIVSPPANAAPVASNDVIVISTGTSIFLSAAWLLNNDTDADGDALSISGAGIGSLPSGWTITSVTAGGVITGFNVSTGNVNQAATLAYTVSDGQGHTSTAQFTIQTPSVASTGNDNDINLGSLSYNYSYIDGKNHEDTLTANLTLSGTQGNDVFVGGNGDDTLEAGAGNNILTGGSGDDTFVFGNFSSVANHVTDFQAGLSSTTIDRLSFDVGTGAGEFSAGNNNATVENFKSGNNAAINFAGTEVAVKTDASVTNTTVQSTINSYGNITTGAFFVFHNTDLGHAAVYYDPNPSAAGGAVLVAELDNVTLLGNLGDVNAADFQFS